MKKIILFLLSVLAFLQANAQKLPNVQQISLRAPANVKIDGKATEWGAQFQAYNIATEIFYTIANDRENLFLVVKAEDPDVIRDITSCGFTFAVTRSKKNEKDGVSVAYPVSAQGKRPASLTLNKTVSSADTSEQNATTIMNSNNTELQKKNKLIIVSSGQKIDTLSIYNNIGIMGACSFDKSRFYTIEIAIPIKYIIASTKSTDKFSYHMIINGFIAPTKYTIDIPENIPANNIEEFRQGMQQSMIELNLRLAKRSPHTDFWGEYTLAK